MSHNDFEVVSRDHLTIYIPKGIYETLVFETASLFMTKHTCPWCLKTTTVVTLLCDECELVAQRFCERYGTPVRRAPILNVKENADD